MKLNFLWTFWTAYGDVAIKILLCIVLTGMIGYNREKNGTPIGIRTHILVGFSAVIVQVTALRYVGISNHSDHLRLAGQFLSGIAFLGTGTIMKEKGNIRGLTTASSIFFAACIGVAVGTGMYVEASMVTLVAYGFLSDFMGLKNFLRSKGKRTITISMELKENCQTCEMLIKEALSKINVTISSLEMTMVSMKKSKVLLKVEAKKDISVNEILITIISIQTVLKVEVLQG